MMDPSSLSSPPSHTSLSTTTPTTQPTSEKLGFIRSVKRHRERLCLLVLATSCVFMGTAIVERGERLDQLEEQALSLKKENQEMTRALGSMNEAVSEAATQENSPLISRLQSLMGPSADGDKSSGDSGSSVTSQGKKKSFMV